MGRAAGVAVLVGAVALGVGTGAVVLRGQLDERDRAAAVVAEQAAASASAQTDRAATVAQQRAAAADSARLGGLAAQAEAVRAAAEEAQRLADEQAAAAQAAADAAAAEQAAAEQAAADAAAKGATSGGAVAGHDADGRPLDADGNVLWVTSVPTADGDGSNGNLPMSAMCAIGWGTDQLGYTQYLRCDAADALTSLNDAYRARFGASIDMDLTYRSYADQVAMKAHFGGLAAAPGTSSHGWGTALDVQEWDTVYGFGTERYTWLVENGPTYGWYAPARVRQGQPYAEYWHFEYGPGRTS
ncbi:M15 family metallopeptidase [Cellulomonas hominis]